MIQAKQLSALPGIGHGFFTRRGGVSGGIYGSLNCGTGSKDDPERVARNRELVAESLGVAADRLVTPYQVHSAVVVVASQPWRRETAPKADAVVSKQPGLAVGVSTADCAPVLMADAEAGVVGAAHAGWRGALTGIVDRAVEQMQELGAERGRIVAVVGPAISQAAYEVGEEFEDRFLSASDENARYFDRTGERGRPHFDLSGYVADRLRDIGLSRIDAMPECTYGQEERLFSYRRSVHRGDSDYGRQISAIVLK